MYKKSLNAGSRNLTASIFILILAVISVSCTTESTPVYRLSTSSSPADAGNVTPQGGEYDEGEQVQLTATANENWVFDGWGGDANGSQNPVSISMNSDKDVVARFIRLTHPFTININGEGTVTESIVQAKTTDYDAGTVIELEAAPATGWDFDSWQDDLQGNQNPARISIDGPKTVTASFTPKEYNVTVQNDGPGSVSVTPEKEFYIYGDMVAFTATPDENAEFLGWVGTFENKSPIVEYEITGNVELTGLFSTVENAIQITTVGFRLVDGLVVDVIFDIANALPEGVELVQFTVDNEDGERFAESNIEEPIVIESRTLLELTVMFNTGVAVPDTFQRFTFNWSFAYKGVIYQISQVVGEPESNNKRRNHLSESEKSVWIQETIRPE